MLLQRDQKGEGAGAHGNGAKGSPAFMLKPRPCQMTAGPHPQRAASEVGFDPSLKTSPRGLDASVPWGARNATAPVRLGTYSRSRFKLLWRAETFPTIRPVPEQVDSSPDPARVEA